MIVNLHLLISRCIFLPIFFLILSFHCAYGDNAHKKVLVVHSYHQEYEWVSTISRGIKIVFERAKHIQVETIYMDTKQKTSLAWKRDSGLRARSVIAQWDPDVVITVDDNAQEYVGKYYVGEERPKIVFCGVNNEPELYGYPASNVTGVLERPHIEDTLRFLEKIIPETKTIAVISDDSPTSKGAMGYIKKAETSIKKTIVAYDMVGTFSEWKSYISDYQHRADVIMVYMYHTLKQEGNYESMVPHAVMDWTIAHSIKPVVGFFNFAIDDGALLGVAESGLEHGQEAALMALGLCQGKAISQFPMKKAKKGLVMFNAHTAKKNGIVVEPHLLDQIDIIVGD